MKTLYLILFLFLSLSSHAQDKFLDKALISFKHAKGQLIHAKEDTSKVRILDTIGYYSSFFFTDSALMYLNQASTLAKKLRFKLGEASVLNDLSNVFSNRGDYPGALDAASKALRIAEKIGDKRLYYDAMMSIGYASDQAGYYQKALDNFYLILHHSAGLKWEDIKTETLYALMAFECQRLNKADSTQYFLHKAYELDLKNEEEFGLLKMLLSILAEQRQEYQKAISFVRPAGVAAANHIGKLYSSTQLAKLYQKTWKTDSAIFFARQAIFLQKRILMPNALLQASQILADIYTVKGQTDSALKYQTIALKMKDSIFNERKANDIQNLSLKEQQHQQDLVNAEKTHQTTVRIYILSGTALAFLVIGFILWRNNKKQKHTNQLLNEQKEEISAQRDNLERQNHELEIEAALEQVRLRTMAMRQSNELVEVSIMVRTQVKGLGIPILGMGFIVWSDDSNFFINYGADPAGGTIKPYTVDVSSAEMFKEIRDARKRGDDLFVLHGEGERLKEVYQALSKYSGAHMDMFKDQIDPTAGQLTHSVFVSNVSLLFITEKPVPEAHDIFKRFGKTFEQTYTRFLDLKQAEEQAHEAQVQLALERVRARTMAMQHSEELSETVFVLFQQFKELGENPDQATIGIFNEEERVIEYWVTMHGSKNNNVYKFSIDEPDVTRKIYDAWKAKKSSLVIDLSGKPLRDFMEYRANMGGATANPDEKRRIINVALFSKGLLNVQSTVERLEESIRLLERFAQVFEQTYTRFLDLQKAEAQAREGQIQLALERVRARTMAMHSSDELTEVAGLLFKQVSDLGVKTWTTGFNVWSEDNNSFVDYITSPQGGFIEPYTVYGSKAELPKQVSDARKNGCEFLVQYAEGKTLEETYRELTKLAHNKQYEKMLEDGVQFPSSQVNHFVFGSKVSLMFITYEPVPEFHDVFKRFGKVFEQTYTRFLDLQKAEAQAREAQIEAALERVRSKTTAMHTSHDIADTVAAMFDELLKLGIKNDVRSGISIISNPEEMEIWTGYSKPGGKVGLNIGSLEIASHPMLRQAYDLWVKKESHSTYTLTGEDQKNYYQAINNSKHYHAKFDIGSLPQKTIQNAFYFPEGFIHIFSHEQITAQEEQIFKRFASVFGLTYRRFLDLEKAEAQAREARIEAALERVRSRTLAMQKSDELAETAAVLFNQMIGLGIEPNRLYIGITNDDSSEIEYWITDEDGSKVSNMFIGDAHKNRSMKKIHDAWKAHQKSMIIDMRGNELTEYFRYLGEILHVPFKGGLAQKRRVQYISFFSNGFIGLASPDDQPQETVDLLDRFAYVFNLTFARFNDIKIAELHALQAEQDLIAIKAARKNAEDALTDLRAAQNKLIQSEKMASLGELTAGIAHEIQNPLNFVNNFSEVSAELIDEMAEELNKGDIEEVKAIAGDIKDNLEKIRHHGKRADGIVKSMLQHSRTNSGQKEPTDLNVLADEYLRLSYHGLRAKDKSFNAELITNFHKGLPKVSVVPQEMGRVILNLINNAFYATQQKQKAAGPHYKPTVEVKTQVLDGQVLISVKDNGIGVPEDIRDKIMQPFFTTKPTGEGTGLGLSLSYDIVVKGHGGKINIESKKGEGSEFIIDLPI